MQATAAALFAAFAVLCWFPLMPQSYENPWSADRETASGLRQDGARYEGERAIVWFEPNVLSAAEMDEFSGLLNKGIVDIESYLHLPPKTWKIRYYVSTRIDISHALLRSVFLPMRRVQTRSAPYLHETTHILVPSGDCPMWFSEGLASYVQSYVSEHMGGYDGVVFARWGNRGIDRQARNWLGNPRGQAVVPFIGRHDEPPEIAYDRSNVAAPFYVLAQSFVKYLVERMGVEQVAALLPAADFESAMSTGAGKSTGQWKESWLEAVETR